MLVQYLWVFLCIIDITFGITEKEYYDELERRKLELLAWYNATFNDTACLFTKENDALLSADDENITFPENSIYFIETSCNGGLDFRQACAVESAARAHPWRQINVFFAGRGETKNNLKQNIFKALLKYKNIKFFKIHLKEYLKGTPLEEVIENRLKNSLYLLHHASDILRFITLYKFGGIYLDLDVITLKSLDYLPVKNFLGRDGDTFAVGVVKLERSGIGKKIIDTIIRNLQYNFIPRKWAANGIGVTRDAVEQVCSTYWYQISSDICKGFKIYDTNFFYSIKDYYEFNTPYKQTLNLTQVYAYHLWNFMLSEDVIIKDSLHSLLSKKYCPEVDKVSSVGCEKRSPGTYPYPIMTIRVERTKVDKLYGSITIGKHYKKNKSKTSAHDNHNDFPKQHHCNKKYEDINKHISINAFKRTRWKHQDEERQMNFQTHSRFGKYL